MTSRSYNDPRWDELEAAFGQKHGVPPELLASIRTYGERSNSDQVSSAGARSVYQIIPETRASIIKKHGIDPYLSDANAVEGAALLLRESLDRNNGDPIAAAGEYHGGPDRSRWGPINAAYRKRVAQGLQHYASLDTAATDAPAEPTINDLMDDYRSGKMAPEAKADFEADVRNGLLAIPARFYDEVAGPQPEEATPDLVEAYQSGKMSPEARADFESDVNAGLLILPQQQVQQKPDDFSAAFADPRIAAAREAAMPERMGAPGGPPLPPADQIQIGTNPLPEQFNDFRSMPELNQLSMAGAKAGIGSMLASDPKEIAQILQANYPNVQIRETPDGIVAQSGMDGVPYLIPNKASMRDLPYAAAKIAPYAALGPAGAATSVWGGAGINLAQQKAREWAGGRPTDYGEVLTAGLVSGAAPVVAPFAAAGTGAIANRFGRGAPVADDAAASAARPPQESGGTAPFHSRDQGIPPSEAAQSVNVNTAAIQQVARSADGTELNAGRSPGNFLPQRAIPASDGLGRRSQASETPRGPAVAQVSEEVPPVNYDDLAQLMRAASEGDTAAAVRLGELMQQQDPAITEAAKRLGFGEDDLPLDWFLASRSAREIVQLAKSQSGSILKEQEVAALSQVGQNAQDVLEELGGTRDLSSLDARIKDGLKSTINDLKEQEKTVWDEIRARIPDQTEITAPQTLAFLLERVKGQNGTAKLTPVEKSIWAEIAGKERASFDGAAVRKTIGERLTTYGRLDTIRQLIGESTGNYMAQNAFSNAPIGLRKKLGGLLKDDLAAAADQQGMAELSRAAKSLTGTRKDFEDMAVSLYGRTLQGSMLTSLESGVKALSKGDVSKLSKVMKDIPENMREPAMASALNAAFNKSFRNGEMSFGAYADWYDRLATNKQAMTLVMSNLPKGAPEKLKALADLSRGIQRSTSLYSTNGKSLQMSLRDALAKSDTLIHNLVGLAKRSSVGLIAEPVAAAFGVPGAGLTAALVSAVSKGRPNTLVELDRLLSTPEFRRLVKVIGTPEEKAAVKALARHGVMARLFGELTGKKGTAADREKWLEESMTNKQK